MKLSARNCWTRCRSDPAFFLDEFRAIATLHRQKVTPEKAERYDYDSGDGSTTNVLTALLNGRSALMKKGMLEGYEKNYFPINDWLHDALRESFKPLIPDDGRYSHVFDKFELLASLGFANVQDSNSIYAGSFPPGSYF